MKKFSYFLILLFSYSHLFAQSYEQNVRSIIDALAADSLEKAEGMIQATLLLDPARTSNAILYQYLGEIYQRRGENEKALEAYGIGIRSIDYSPLPTDFYSPLCGLLLSRASLYLQTNNLERGLADYNKVFELEPDNEEALFFRAYIYSQQRRNKEARADYNRLLEINPMHEDGRLGLAILNNKDGRPREAMEQLDALVQLFPTHARHYLARCGLYEQRKEYEKAMRDVEEAIELEPENPECYLTRASLYLAMKKKRLANQDCRKAISLGANPNQAAPLLEKTGKP